jgi:hypothetical protein
VGNDEWYEHFVFADAAVNAYIFPSRFNGQRVFNHMLVSGKQHVVADAFQ